MKIRLKMQPVLPAGLGGARGGGHFAPGLAGARPVGAHEGLRMLETAAYTPAGTKRSSSR